MVGMPNNLLLAMSEMGQATAWVRDNVVRYTYPNGVNIKYVAVGNEPFLKSYKNKHLVTTYCALVNVQRALNAAGLGDQVKATVPMNADIIESAGLPSSSVFRPDIVNSMIQILAFLTQNGAPFIINIYPFISLHEDPNFPVEYAFFEGTNAPIIDGFCSYHNVFDASFDSLIAALGAAGPYDSIDVLVGEIGWPTDGEKNANIAYAKKFNQGFLNHAISRVGTPRRPNRPIEFYLSSLVDEDLRSIQPGNFERHWGIFRYDGRPKYTLSLMGSNEQNLVQASGVKYLARKWCIYNSDRGLDHSTLDDMVTYACSLSDCTSIGYGGSCNTYLDADANASYAFNSYFQRHDQELGTCVFNGLGQMVTKDPSIGACEFMIQIAVSGVDGSWLACKSMKALHLLLWALVINLMRHIY